MVFIILWALLGIATGKVAERRGHRFGLWVLLGIVFAPLALVVAFFLPLRVVPGETRRCPSCREVVPVAASVCRFCFSPLPAVPVLTEEPRLNP
jgi:hypothetical protein